MTGKAPSTSHRKIYELAKDLQEAKELRDSGFGFETRKAAEKAKAEARDEGADPFYVNMLKVFELEIANET